MKDLLDLYKQVLWNGTPRIDRTGVGTIATFGEQIHFDLSKGFPLVTTKKLYFRAVVQELLWFISGDTNIRSLILNKTNIWNEWAFQRYLVSNNMELEYPKYQARWRDKLNWFALQIESNPEFAKQWGDLGPIYGKQWRNFSGIDQLQNALDQIVTNPNSRRIIVSSWNPPEIPYMALPPCHLLYQFEVDGDKLSCAVTMRSWDLFIGAPFNIASYALLTQMVAHVTGLTPGTLVFSSNNTHIYVNHLEQINLQLERDPKPLSNIHFARPISSLFDFKADDIILTGYTSHPVIKGDKAV